MFKLLRIKNSLRAHNRSFFFFASHFFPFSFFFASTISCSHHYSYCLLACTYISKTVSSYVQPHVQVFRSFELSQLRGSNPFAQAGGVIAT